jgi:hypothetical protein
MAEEGMQVRSEDAEGSVDDGGMDQYLYPRRGPSHHVLFLLFRAISTFKPLQGLDRGVKSSDRDYIPSGKDFQPLLEA